MVASVTIVRTNAENLSTPLVRYAHQMITRKADISKRFRNQRPSVPHPNNFVNQTTYRTQFPVNVERS